MNNLDLLVCKVKDNNGEYFCFKDEVDFFINELYKDDNGVVVETQLESVFIERYKESGFVLVKEFYKK